MSRKENPNLQASSVSFRSVKHSGFSERATQEILRPKAKIRPGLRFRTSSPVPFGFNQKKPKGGEEMSETLR